MNSQNIKIGKRFKWKMSRRHRYFIKEDINMASKDMKNSTFLAILGKWKLRHSEMPPHTYPHG